MNFCDWYRAVYGRPVPPNGWLGVSEETQDAFVNYCYSQGACGDTGQPSLLGFLGEIGLSLTTDKRNYQVGESPRYLLTGAIPGSTVVWTSYKNGVATGEVNSGYGDSIAANGTAELTGGAWTENDIGNWAKEVLVISPDGAEVSNALISFSVSAKAAGTTGQAAPAPGSGFLDGEIDLPIVGSVPKVAALIGAGAGLYLLLGKKGR